MGKSMFELNLFDQPSTPIVQNRISQNIEGTYEIRGRHKNGDTFPLEVTAKTTIFNGKKVRAAVVRNVESILIRHLELLKDERKLNVTLIETIKALSKAVEAKDPYTSGHETNVSLIAVGIGTAMGLNGSELEGLQLGSLIHDIGKISIPSEILSKPGKLKPEEFALIKLHPELGADIIGGLKLPWPVREMIHQHHERIDGSGYPKGLNANEICTEAKIIAVADAFEAVSSHRPYRPSLGFKTALSIIQQGSGVIFDADIVSKCTEFAISSELFN